MNHAGVSFDGCAVWVRGCDLPPDIAKSLIDDTFACPAAILVAFSMTPGWLCFGRTSRTSARLSVIAAWRSGR